MPSFVARKTKVFILVMFNGGFDGVQ